MEKVRRLFVEQRPEFDVVSTRLLNDLRQLLEIDHLQQITIIQRFDLCGVNDAEYQAACAGALSKSGRDIIHHEMLPTRDLTTDVVVEPQPGQYDQRADWAAQAIQFQTGKDKPLVKTATVYRLQGKLAAEEFDKIKAHLINPVESREIGPGKPASLRTCEPMPPDVAILDGFTKLKTSGLSNMCQELGLAMTTADLEFCQKYFRDQEKRDPSYAELRVLDTYWSDHCRHSTFNTQLDNIEFELEELSLPIMSAYREYRRLRQELGRSERRLCLMDLATIGARELQRQGKLDNLDASEEVNACSITVQAKIDGQLQDWLIMFKNETHNHPTEIEPFGGASTCLGGAIRDPLSGRSYVYQAMRITGAGDPRTPLSETLAGKLAQRRITTTAAAGYSSYGNQIGVAAGKVQEVYHPGFVAKRMELGAVVAAAPKANVVRAEPAPGDVILLIGGRTGRDGCGGATGSSKAHTDESLEKGGAEVQKGNPLIERNIQRLFRQPEFSTLIKRCNDFGAGGVCVAIGELAPGLEVNLDLVPTKYDGLDGTELAIAESQERMACVIAPENVATAIALANAENLEATAVAKVTAEPRLSMTWRGKNIISLSRDFLDSQGVTQKAEAYVQAPEDERNFFRATAERTKSGAPLPQLWLDNLRDLNICSQQGLAERFDATAGAATVLCPYGGKLQLTPNEAMVAKIPVSGRTDACTIMSHGYNPLLSEWSPFHGALYAVIEANAKIAAAGGDVSQTRMSFQEYFERLGDDPAKWGKPLAALLGGLRGQLEFGTAAIGGKDSMSGSFEDISVPPTLVAFALAPALANQIVSPEFKSAGNLTLLLPAPRDNQELPDFARLRQQFSQLRQWAKMGRIAAAHTVGQGGLAATISKMCFGNWLGFDFEPEWNGDKLFSADYGAIVIEAQVGLGADSFAGAIPLGRTTAEPIIAVGKDKIQLDEALAAWQKPLAEVFPIQASTPVTGAIAGQLYTAGNASSRQSLIKSQAKPRVLIPVFPGTTGEYDTEKAFALAGAEVECLVIRNQTADVLAQSWQRLHDALANSQILALVNGFSTCDDQDGAGSFLAATFRQPRLAEAIANLLHERDGLILGLGSGFHALLQLGLLPQGQIANQPSSDAPFLASNPIGRHHATLVRTMAMSNLSPWLRYCQPGEVQAMAVSHSEGRLVANPQQVQQWFKNGQVAFQYVDLEGKPATAMPWNPNGSVAAIEGITSLDGKILGKMGLSERGVDSHLCRNVPVRRGQGIFQAGVDFFG